MKYWNFKVNAATETEPEGIELRIEGDIVDDEDAWIYQWFGMECTSPNAFKAALAEHAGKDLTVWIDSYGGSVFAATGIYNALKEHNGKVTVKIDSKAMSAASVIAMAGDEILMSPIAILMIHNPLTEVYGYSSDLRKTADVLDEIKEAIINSYQLKTGRSRNKISALMDDESYMSAKTAIKEGFADSMLYTEGQTIENMEAFNYAFNRHTIMNSSNEAVKRMIALQNTDPDPTPPPENSAEKEKLLLEIDLI